MQTKTVSGWGCDCPEYPHNSLYCDKRYPVIIEIPTEPDWRAPARKHVKDDVSRETDLPSEVYATSIWSEDAPRREISRLLAASGTRGTYARGYPPGDVTYQGECGSCHKMVRLKLNGDLYKHTCISEQAIEGGSSATRPVDGTITPIPTESIVIKGYGWRIIYENGKFTEGWVVNDGVWTRVGAVEAKRRAFQFSSI